MSPYFMSRRGQYLGHGRAIEVVVLKDVAQTMERSFP